MMATETLLIEIGTEELPPSHLSELSYRFADNIAKALIDLGLTYDDMEHFSTPRRIAARFFNVPAIQHDRQIQKRGPTLTAAFDVKGEPTKAALGFAQSCNTEVTKLQKKGDWLAYEYVEPGKPLEALLPHIIESALNHIPAPKRMRWGDKDIAFLRPIHWVAAVYGNRPLSMSIWGFKTSNLTYGHRVHHPEAIVIDHADNYLSILSHAKVIADSRERKEKIKVNIQQLAEKNNGIAMIDEALLDQVSGLVEWPVPLFAHFDRDFLTVPPEALISSMQNHQKCFALKTATGKLLPTFILISNVESKTPENIIRGNERVMHARLADAKFFYEKDCKTPLVSRLENLNNMVFQKKLGTLYDKSQRIAKLAGNLAKQLDVPPRFCERAGKLCKADLLSEMVFEFPELQGIMGSYYALNDGEPPEVAEAIRESYLPRFAKDLLPESNTGICVALADRLDSIIGIFGIGQIPSGDKDPYALRRQAVAILRILIEKKLPLDLQMLCQMALQGYGNLIEYETIHKVLIFCFDRFKAWYQEQGIHPQVIDAVLANHVTEPYDASLRVHAVNHFQTLPEAQALSAANKRVKNILQKSDIELTRQGTPVINPALLKEKEEQALADALSELKKQTTPLILAGKYQDALCLLAKLQPSVDAFFDAVLVMTEDEELRQNRIHLLCQLSALFIQIADISKLAL